MNYKEALNYIDNINSFGVKLGLERMKILMSKLGNPQDRLKIIHIAGTNGKGSASAMIMNILKSQGYNVGMYTSPHLQKYNERYNINGKNISDSDFSNILEIVKNKCEEMVNCGQEQPTIFEVLTAMAFVYFEKSNLDYVIIEVGLGGRFDATNIIKMPIVSIIMSISFDHMNYLGNTILSIANEKSGIIKKNCPVVLYSQGLEVYNIINNVCKKNNSKLYYAKENKINILSENLKETIFSVKNEYFCYGNIKIKLIGDYQIRNAITVLLACRALKDEGVLLCENNILQGLKNTKWNGRMEILKKEPLFIVDGAHNLDGINMLSCSVKKYFSDKYITLIIGVLSDKEYQKMSNIIIPLVNNIIITEPENDRKLDVDNFEKTILSYNKPIHKFKKIKDAVNYAIENSKKDEVILCTGSLYMVGEVRHIIKKDYLGG